MLLLKLSLILLLFKEYSLKLLDPSKNRTKTHFLNYLKAVPKEITGIYSVIAVLGTCGPYTQDIASWFLIENAGCPTIIINKDYKSTYSLYTPKVKTVFCFIDTVDDVEDFLKHNMYHDFWHNLGYFQFIIGKPVDDYEWVLPTLKIIWKSYILNFVVAFSFGGKMEVISYNPFNETMLNFTGFTLDENVLFKDKTKNFYGYTLKVGMFDDFPRNVYKSGSFYGKDVRLLRQFISKVNATLKYIVVKADSVNQFKILHENIYSGKADFTFICHFQLATMHEGKFSYPRQMDDVVVIVESPREVPQYLNMVHTFDVPIWIYLGFTFAFTVFVLYMFKTFQKENVSIDKSFLDVLVLSVSTQLYSFQKSKKPVKVLLLFWSIFSLVICTLFQSSLTSVLVTPLYYNGIKTLPELRENGYNVCIPFGLYNILNVSTFPVDFIPMLRDEIIEKIQKGDTSCSYALPLSYIAPLLDFKQTIGKPTFEIVEEHLIPGYGVYFFHAQSPYIKAINDFILLERQFVLNAYNNNTWSKNKEENDKIYEYDSTDEYTVFTIEHFEGVFLILGLGYMVSVVVFVFEVGLYYFMKHCKVVYYFLRSVYH